MERKFSTITLLIMAMSFASSAQNYVTLYTDCNYRGTSEMFKAGRYHTADTRIGSQNLSSVKVPSGMKLIIYNNNESQKYSFTNDNSCLTNVGWNDRAFSFVVETTGGVTNLPESPGNNQNMAILYEDCNFRGGYSSLSAGYHNWNGLGIRNDQLSSIRLPYGWSVTLYENSDYRGRSIVYNNSVSCLPSGWNDRVSSVLISTSSNNNNNSESNPSYPDRYEGVTIYRDCQYRGTSQLLRTGDYNVNSLRIGNDELSSFRVPAGWSITIYENSNFSGARSTYSNDISCLTRAWNDKTSSIRVARSGNGYDDGYNIDNNPTDYVILYSQENFTGKSITLRPGRIPNLPSVGFPDNALSSLKLPSGWRVVLFDQPNFRGSSYSVLRTKDKFNFSGWGRRASSMIIYETGGNY